jgi:hypothetical protein
VELTMPPTVSVADFNLSGIALVPYSSPEFPSLAVASVPDSLMGALWELLPFSVFLRNDSNKTVIAYTASWTMTDSAGQHDAYYSTVCDATSLKGLALPHTCRLVTIIEPPTASSANNPQVLQDIAEQAQRLKAQASVAIALELVVFEDGSSIGADPLLSLSEVRARLRSEYDLYKSVVASTEPDESFSAWLQALAGQVKPGSTLKFDKDPFAGWYRFYQVRTASALLQMTGLKGRAETVSYVRSRLESKRYPPLIVNP